MGGLDDGLECLRFESGHGQEIFVSKTFRRALGPTQPPLQCTMVFYARGEEAGGVIMTTYLCLVQG